MDNFLSARDLIIQRLREQSVVTDAKKIRPATSAAWVTKNQLDQSVSVIFFDDVPDTTPGGQALRGSMQTSEQYWLLIISAKNVSDAGSAAQLDAGVIFMRVLRALQGHKLSPEHAELHRQKSPYRATDDNGFVHMPLLFSTRLITTV